MCVVYFNQPLGAAHSKLWSIFFLMWAVLSGLPLFDHLRSVFPLSLHINIQQYVFRLTETIDTAFPGGIRTNRGRVSSVIRPELYLQATTAGFWSKFVLNIFYAKKI